MGATLLEGLVIGLGMGLGIVIIVVGGIIIVKKLWYW